MGVSGGPWVLSAMEDESNSEGTRKVRPGRAGELSNATDPLNAFSLAEAADSETGLELIPARVMVGSTGLVEWEGEDAVGEDGAEALLVGEESSMRLGPGASWTKPSARRFVRLLNGLVIRRAIRF